MSSPVRAVPSLLFAIVLFQSATSNVFFPVETNHEDLVHYRSLKDILFRSQSEAEETAHSIASPVVLAGFRPANPSPTLASPPHTGVGVSKIRFLEADEFFIPSLFPPITHPEFLPPAPTIQTEGRRANAQNSAAVDPTALVRQAKSANSSAVDDISVADSVQDRWPWPYSKPIKQQSAANVQTRQLQKPVPNLVVKKSVAKPYRLLTRTSTCPKLLHDLTITCAFPNQQPLSQPVVSFWISCMLIIWINQKEVYKVSKEKSWKPWARESRCYTWSGEKRNVL